MIKKINTFPKFYMEKRAKEGDAKNRALISILSTVDSDLPKEIHDMYGKVMTLRFDDIELSWVQMQTQELDEAYEGLTPFRGIDCAKIRLFIERVKDAGIDEIDIHCTAGVSRSGAVGVGIAMILDDENLMEETIMNNNILPNNYVLSKIHAELGTNIHMPMMKIYSAVMKRIELNKTKTILGGN